jgi:hypothetical protein
VDFRDQFGSAINYPRRQRITLMPLQKNAEQSATFERVVKSGMYGADQTFYYFELIGRHADRPGRGV